MLNGIKYAIFDIDGTLLDTLEDLNASMNNALAERGFPRVTVEETRNNIGYGARENAKRSLPLEYRDNDEAIDGVHDAYKAGIVIEKTHVFEGINELLDYLKGEGVRLAVLSNKPEVAALDAAERYFDADLFDAVLGQRKDVAPKPSTESLNLLFELLGGGIKAEECLYFGDGEPDYQICEASGMIHIGCLWGYRSEAVLRRVGATNLFHTPFEVIDYLKKNF